MQAQDLIDEVLKTLGVVAEVDTPTSDQRNKCLSRFNAMLDSWNAEEMLLPYKDTQSFNLVIGDGDYSIGPSGADFTASRPLEILLAEIRDSNNSDSPVRVISWEEFESLDDPSLATGRPQFIAYQRKTPSGIIKVSPRPDQAYALRLTTSNLFSTLTLSSTIDNNPGYLEGFKYNLMEREAIARGRKLDPGIITMASNSLRAIRRKTITVDDAPIPSGVLGSSRSSYDIDKGE